MNDEKIKECVSEILTNILNSSDKELLECSEEELDHYWFFIWDEKYSPEYNLYRFHQCLSMFEKKVRKWEEHHNGTCCVVERVRDKYLYPKIKSFLQKVH